MKFADKFKDSSDNKYRPSKEELASIGNHLKNWEVGLRWVTSVTIIEQEEEGVKDALVQANHPMVIKEANAFTLLFEIGSDPTSGDWCWDKH